MSVRRVASRGNLIRVAVGVVALAVLLAFVIQNSQSVPVHFVVATVRTPLIWALFLSAILGLLIGLVLPYSLRRSRRR